MRARFDHSALLLIVALSGLAVGYAGAQTPLRGSIAPPLTAEPLAGQSTALPAPPVTLPRPDSVRRMGADPELRPSDPAGDVPSALPSDDMSVTAPAGDATATGEPMQLRGFPSPRLEEEPQPLRRRPPAEADPYGPVGITAGAFLLKPSIEVELGYDSNPGRQPGKTKGSLYSAVVPKLEFASQWSRSELRGTLSAGYTRYFAVNDNRPRANGVVDGRFDVNNDLSLTAQGRFNLDTERLGDDGVSPTATKRPIVMTYGASLGAERRVGPLTFALRGDVDRAQYERGPGQSVSRNYNTYGLSLRTGYEVSAAIKPFIDISVDKRIHDDAIDQDGFRRDSTGGTAQAGVELALTASLRGEVSAGYGRRRYDDYRLRDMDGLVANASLVWTPTALTTISLHARTDFDETTYAGSSGFVARTAGIDITHALRRYLIVTAGIAATQDRYDGIKRNETYWDATAGIEYKLSRTVSVRASYAYRKLNSTVPGNDYTANTFFVGLRLQR